MTPQETELKIAIEEPRTWARRLTITVPAERVERERQEVSRKWSQRIRLPGFRKGRVPAHVIERRFGAAVEQEAIEQVVGAAYREALAKEGLQPITQGAIEEIDYRPGEDLTFRVQFEIQPVIELDRLGGFQVERPKIEVTDADVDQVVERLRAQQAVLKPVADEAPVAGDEVIVSITELSGDGAEGGAGEPRRYRLELGAGRARPELEEMIRALKPGEEGEVTLPALEEGGEEAASEQRLRIQLLEVYRPELPEANDEFARSLGDFPDLETLRARIREDLERDAEQEAERAVRNALLDMILEANPFEVPDSMVDRYLDNVLRPGKDADPEQVKAVKESARPAAERALKRMLVIEKVAEMEGLAARSEEVDARIDEMAERTGRPASELRAQLRKTGRLAALEEEITEDTVFEFLKSLSTVN